MRNSAALTESAALACDLRLNVTRQVRDLVLETAEDALHSALKTEGEPSHV